MLQSVWRILSAQGLTVQVDLLSPQGTRHADRRALAEHLREQIGAQLHAAPAAVAPGGARAAVPRRVRDGMIGPAPATGP